MKKVSNVILHYLRYTGHILISEVMDCYKEANHRAFLKFDSMQDGYYPEEVVKEYVYLLTFIEKRGRFKVIIDMCALDQLSNSVLVNPYNWHQSVVLGNADTASSDRVFLYLTIAAIRDGKDGLCSGFTCVGFSSNYTFYHFDGVVRGFHSLDPPECLNFDITKSEGSSVYTFHVLECDCGCHQWHVDHVMNFET